MKLNKEQLINIIKEELELEQQRTGPSMKDEFEEKLYRSLKESHDLIVGYELDTDEYAGGYHEVIKDLLFQAMEHLEQQRAELRKSRTRGVAPDF